MSPDKLFKFSPEHRTGLIAAWKRESDRDIAYFYLNDVESLVDAMLVDYEPDEKTPHEERDDRIKILGLSRRLRGALLNQSKRDARYLEQSLMGLMCRKDGETIIPKDWSNENHRDRLIQCLAAVEKYMTVQTSVPISRTARRDEKNRLHFMGELVRYYRMHFGKYPSKQPKGNFRPFLKTLSEYIEMPMGENLLAQAILDVKALVKVTEYLEKGLRLKQ